MKSSKTSIFKKLFLIKIGCVATIYFLSCFSQYVRPENGVIFTLLSLSFPVVLCLMLLATLVCYFINKKIFIGCLLIIFFGYNNIINTFAFHLKNHSNIGNTKTIKVLSWNTNSVLNKFHFIKIETENRTKMLHYIGALDADILCLQDNTFCFDTAKKTSDVKDLEKLGYIYHVLSDDFNSHGNTRMKYGSGIFSKYPITYSNKVNYTGHFYESLLFADINIHNKTLRVFNTHLRSMRLSETGLNPLEEYTMSQDDTAIIFHSPYLKKLSYFDIKHAEQATIARKVLDTTKLPFIFCADLNCVPSSYVYHHLAKGLKDAFLEKGFGLGHTYYGLSHTLRIDVTLTSPDIKTLDYASPHLDLSDHYPVITTLALP